MPPVFGTDSDAKGRPDAPTIFLTDITSNASAKGGDWQNGGQAAAIGASGIFGSWSPTDRHDAGQQEQLDSRPERRSDPGDRCVRRDDDLVQRGLRLRGQVERAGLKAYDPMTGTFVAVQPGHTYRAQSMTHDTDENHTSGGGDVGEVCTTFHIPVAHLTITKTADLLR